MASRLATEKTLVAAPPEAADARVLISSGQPLRQDIVLDSGRLMIVNPETHRECKDGELGEIWLCGKSKTLGYWNKEKETKETFKVAYLLCLLSLL